MTNVTNNTHTPMTTGSSSLPSPRQNLAIDFIELRNVVTELQDNAIPELKYPFSYVQKEIDMIITTIPRITRQYTNLLSEFLYLVICYNRYHAL